MIRTPDQRLRVFVSSSLTEFREERTAVRRAIERLRLIPVLFEGGARPYPAQHIYRSYLEQSDVFIALYGRTYGWVAPQMDISGLEDEYHLADGKPRLIYIRLGSEKEREPGLVELVKKIKESDQVSYQKFSSPEELEELVLNDLALLLSERFAQERTATPPLSCPMELPLMRSASIGRDAECDELQAMILRPDAPLVTLTGPGGTGKSHLALRTAHALLPRFRDGARYVALSVVNEPGLVITAIAKALGMYDIGERPLQENVQDALADKELLLLLDNFEHVLEAAPVIARLLERAPGLKVLATSRAPLHLLGEQVYPVPPLREPNDPTRTSMQELLATPSVQLFLKRANAGAARIGGIEPEIRAVAALCKRLNGLPLAIELAAAHTKYFSPTALLARMDKALDLLANGPRDLPERQRTMRAAIASSYDLLNAECRTLFRRLAVFNDSWSLEQAATVTATGQVLPDLMAATESLVDMGLVRLAQPRPEAPLNEPRFTMLHVVREFALEQLALSDEREQLMARLTQWCIDLIVASAPQLFTDAVDDALDLIEMAHADIREVLRHAMERNDLVTAWRVIGRNSGFWFYRGYMSEAMEWLRLTGTRRLREGVVTTEEVPVEVQAEAAVGAGVVCFYASEYASSAAYLDRAVELCTPLGDETSIALARLFSGLSRMSMGDLQGGADMKESIVMARRSGNQFALCLALAFITEHHARLGDAKGAMAGLAEAEQLAREPLNRVLLAMVLMVKGNLAMCEERFHDAIVAYKECIDLHNSTRVFGPIGWAQNGMAYAYMRVG
nr:DUF4062 domain-containing protein [Flavobacteriales bacterium]